MKGIKFKYMKFTSRMYYLKLFVHSLCDIFVNSDAIKCLNGSERKLKIEEKKLNMGEKN